VPCPQPCPQPRPQLRPQRNSLRHSAFFCGPSQFTPHDPRPSAQFAAALRRVRGRAHPRPV